MFKMDIIVPYSFDSCVLTHSAISHHTLVNKKVQKCSLNKYITPKDRKELNDSESMLDMDVILVESYTSLFYPLAMRKVDQICGITTGEEGYLILRKPYDFDSTAKMGERGSFELNGRQKKMYLMPCFALTCLRKIYIVI
jgi:hypothetical protein